MVLYLAVGDIGSGKTLITSINGRYAKEIMGRTFKSNFKNKYAEPIDVNTLIDLEIENCFLGIDEIDTIIDSRNSQTDVNKLVSNFIKQSRKRDVDIFGTSQLDSMIELRFSDLVNRILLCEYVGNPKNPNGFNYRLYNKNGLLLGKLYLSIEKAKPFFDDYDTKEVIYPVRYFAGKYIDIKEIEKLFKTSPTKLSFIALAKKTYSYVSMESYGAIYDLLKVNDIKSVKKILGVKDDINKQNS